MKPCTITITNKGRKLMAFKRGERWVMVLEVRCVDKATGQEISPFLQVVHSTEGDTITLEVFYDEQRPGSRVDD
jgi:hypothetical protein